MKQAIILAAGEGQRLWPFTISRPKAMLSIASRPILHHVIESLATDGVRDIVVVVGYRREEVYDYLGSGERFGVDISYVTQEKQLGTAHALACAREVAAGEFLVLPGDNLIEADTIAGFIDITPPAVLVKRVDNPMRYGVVNMERGRFQGIVEKPKEAARNMASTGIYAFDRRVFEYTETTLDIPDVLNGMVADGQDIGIQETEGTWLDVVYPWDILSLNGAVLQRMEPKVGGTIERGVIIKGRVSVGQGTVIHANSYIAGPAVIGSGCEIGPGVSILPATSIGDNVVISSFTEVRNSVIAGDVHIGPSCIIQDSVIARGCLLRGAFSACSSLDEVKVGDEWHQARVGAMMGEDCVVGGGVVARAGVIVGNGCRVDPMKLIGGNLPDGSLVL